MPYNAQDAYKDTVQKPRKKLKYIVQHFNIFMQAAGSLQTTHE